MTQLVVPDLGDDARDRLADRSRRNNRSVEEEARAILRGAVLDDGDPGNIEAPPPPTESLGARIVALFSGSGIGLDEPIKELRGHATRPPVDFRE